MIGRTHDVAALTALSVAAVIFPPSSLTLASAVAALIGNQLGGMTPDLDEPVSPIWRSNMVAGFVGRLVDMVLVGHRQLSHSLVGLVLFAALFRLLLQFISSLLPGMDVMLVWWSYILGVVSHLVMDSLTEEGVPWLWPFPLKFGFPPIKAFRIKTGGWVERLVVFPGLVLVNLWLLYAYYPAVLSFLQHNLR